MKRTFVILTLILSTIAAEAQMAAAQTYKGAMKLPERIFKLYNEEEGYCEYKYKVVDGKRVCDGNFVFTLKSRGLKISGSFANGVPAGKWTLNAELRGFRYCTMEKTYRNGIVNGPIKYTEKTDNPDRSITTTTFEAEVSDSLFQKSFRLTKKTTRGQKIVSQKVSTGSFDENGMADGEWKIALDSNVPQQKIYLFSHGQTMSEDIWDESSGETTNKYTYVEPELPEGASAENMKYQNGVVLAQSLSERIELGNFYETVFNNWFLEVKNPFIPLTALIQMYVVNGKRHEVRVEKH